VWGGGIGTLVLAEATREFVEVDRVELVLGDRRHVTELAVFLDARQFDVVAGRHVRVGILTTCRLLIGLGAIQGLLGAVADRESVLEVATNLGQPIFVGSRSVHALGDLGDRNLKDCDEAVELGGQPRAVFGRAKGLGKLGSVVVFGVHDVTSLDLC